jgi:hypothetical protein
MNKKTSVDEVLYFIHHIFDGKTCEERNVIHKFFGCGYCYYFASMLKAAFLRGHIAWAAPYSHCVWVDVDGTPYDIEGIYDGEYSYLIPIEFAETVCDKFKHIFRHNSEYSESYIVYVTQEDIQHVCRAYCAANNIKYQDPYGDWYKWKGDVTKW